MRKISERHEQRLHDACTAAASLLLCGPIIISAAVRPSILDTSNHTIGLSEEEEVVGIDGEGDKIVIKAEAGSVDDDCDDVDDDDSANSEIHIVPLPGSSIRRPSNPLIERNSREDEKCASTAKVIWCLCVRIFVDMIVLLTVVVTVVVIVVVIYCVQVSVFVCMSTCISIRLRQFIEVSNSQLY